jgi:hypothetical protein
MKPQGLLDALDFWKNQITELMNGVDNGTSYEDILQDMEDFASETVIDDSEDVGPEFDSAGFSDDDRIVNGEYRVIDES